MEADFVQVESWQHFGAELEADFSAFEADFYQVEMDGGHLLEAVFSALEAVFSQQLEVDQLDHLEAAVEAEQLGLVAVAAEMVAGEVE